MKCLLKQHMQLVFALFVLRKTSTIAFGDTKNEMWCKSSAPNGKTQSGNSKEAIMAEAVAQSRKTKHSCNKLNETKTNVLGKRNKCIS